MGLLEAGPVSQGPEPKELLPAASVPLPLSPHSGVSQLPWAQPGLWGNPPTPRRTRQFKLLGFSSVLGMSLRFSHVVLTTTMGWMTYFPWLVGRHREYSTALPRKRQAETQVRLDLNPCQMLCIHPGKRH